MNARVDLSTKVKPRLTCRLCASKDLELVVPMEAIPQGDGYVPPERVEETKYLFPHGANFCRTCGHVQTTVDVDQSFIYKHYIWTTGISPGLAASYKQYVDELATRFFPNGGAFATEIGCNDGTFTRIMRDRGFKVLGVEPAANLAERLTKDGIDVVCDFFTEKVAKDIIKTRGQADLIVANHVFANINDNDEIIRGVKTLLKPDGVFSVQVFYLYDVMRSFLLENFNHEHPSYMYVRALRQFFDRFGMELFDVKRVETKGGSIRCFVQHKGGNRAIGPGVKELIDKEEAMGLHKAETYKLLRDHISETRANFAKQLAPLKKAGKKIAAYGTSIGATVFTYQYHLGEFIDFFVDDDKSRHGLVTPGFGIPVYSSDAIYERKPDVVVITAPLYADIIIGKHQKYLDQGGKFMVFRPAFKVISR